MAGVNALLVQMGMVSFVVAVACGGSSVRHERDDTSDDGVTIPSGNRGGTGSTGGTGGTGGKDGAGVNPFLCVELEDALDEAKSCIVDADCGQILQNWTCRPGTLSGVTPKPPVVNLGADVRDVELLFAEAAQVGGCPLVTYGCNDCVVDGFACLAGKCDWRVVDCGPPPN